MLLTPIKITFYDKKTQEVLKTYEQSVITFDMLIRASHLEAAISDAPKKEKKWWSWWEKPVNKEEEQINALMRLVVDFFDGQFTVDQLRTGADVSEVMTVLQSIMGRANSITRSNPTRPRRTRSK